MAQKLEIYLQLRVYLYPKLEIYLQFYRCIQKFIYMDMNIMVTLVVQWFL